MQIITKIKNYVFAFFLIVGMNACGGEASTTTEEDTESTETTASQTEEENTEESSSEETSENTEKVGFEKMVELFFKNYNLPQGEKTKILKNDITNGYLEYEANQNGTVLKYPGQIGYFTTSSGGELLVVATPSCMQACGYGLSFFQMEGEKLIVKATEGFIEGMDKMNEFSEAIFEQAQAKMTSAEKEAQKKGAMGLYDQIITIPQQGTTITFEKITNLDGEKKKILVAELQYNVATGTFTFIKK